MEHPTGRRFWRSNRLPGVAVVVTSGGLSHFPGTDRYDKPEIEFDRKFGDIVEVAVRLRGLFGEEGQPVLVEGWPAG